MKQLYGWYGDRVNFVDVFIRQAHPGECRGPYRTYEEKVESAREYQREEGIPWMVLVDDLPGTVHNSYGGMADPVYLLDSMGRVAFYGMWTHAPTLKRAIDELLARGGQGTPVAGGIDRVPHLLASFVNGWHGLKRGCDQAVADYNRATPGAATLTYLGHLAKPVLAPLALRAAPLPVGARVAVAGAFLSTAALIGWLLGRRPRGE